MKCNDCGEEMKPDEIETGNIICELCYIQRQHGEEEPHV